MDAGCEFLHFLCMALHALSGHQLFGSSKFMDVPMTGSAGRLAEDRVGAGRKSFRFIRMAGSALNSGDFGGMREFLDSGVAILAAENCVCASGMLDRINGNAFAGVRFHSGLSVAG
jgi:hypothetical protein